RRRSSSSRSRASRSWNGGYGTGPARGKMPSRGAWRGRAGSCRRSIGMTIRCSTGTLTGPSMTWSPCWAISGAEVERTMLEELKEENIVNKVGGRFKLSTLIQKRMIALNQGARPLVDMPRGDKMAIVIQEIKQDKIFLDTSGN